MLLPHDGKELNAFGLEAMEAGIPVVNLDRAFPDALAYRLQIKGDNYGMGVAAGHYIGEQLKAKGVSQPDHRRDRRHRLAGADPGAQRRASRPRWPTYGFKVANRRAGRVHRRLRPDGGDRTCCRRCRRSTRSGTTTTTRASACWPRSSRPTARSSSWSAAPARRPPWTHIAADNTVLKATVTYSPSMASSAISLARLIGQGKGMADLVELQVPEGDHPRLRDDHQGEREQVPAKLGF